MKELALKYGCNPNQKPSRIFMKGDGEPPIATLSGRPGHISFIDALNGRQPVKELKTATGLSVAASLKRVSPAGTTVGLPLDGTLRKIYWVDDMGELLPLASAYARVRGANRMSSFGDFISLSDVHNADMARIIKREVFDGVIVPGHEPEVPGIPKSKKNGNYNVTQIDPNYRPKALECKQVSSATFEQGHNNLEINRDLLEDIVAENRYLPDSVKIDLMISLAALKYMQSNSVCYIKGGQTIGTGVGQQSRVYCIHPASSKVDNWYLRRAPQVMNLPFAGSIKRADRDNAIDVYTGGNCMDVLADGRWEKTFKVRPPVLTAEEKRAWLDTMTDVAPGSDAFFPFGDNIDRVSKSGVKYVVQSGGSVRDNQVTGTCNQYGTVTAFTGIRLSHH